MASKKKAAPKKARKPAPKPRPKPAPKPKPRKKAAKRKPSSKNPLKTKVGGDVLRKAEIRRRDRLVQKLLLASEPKLKQQRGVCKKEAFLAAFVRTASVSKAAAIVKIERGMHYRWLAEDAEYAARFEQAKDQAAQTLEDEAIRRANEGTLKPVFYKGFRVATIREYSDRLMEFLLKGWRPDKFKDRVEQEVTGSIDLVERLAAARKRLKKPEPDTE